MHEKLYFQWLVDRIEIDGEAAKRSKLMELLHTTPFVAVVDLDNDWYSSGNQLRRLYASRNGIDPEEFSYLSSRHCSVLEMMIQLSSSIDDYLNGNTDRLRDWFWRMIRNLGLYFMVDDLFDRKMAEYHLKTFIDRTYSPNGAGNIFTTKQDKDMRMIPIWIQFQMYYSDYYFNTSVMDWRRYL